MSEALIASMQVRINELTQQVATLNAEGKKRRLAARELQAKLDAAEAKVNDLATDRDSWKQKAEAAPSDVARENEELKGKLRTRAHKDAFADILSGKLQDKATVDAFWREINYKADGDVPDPQRINELVGKARESAPYLFRPEGGETPPPAARAALTLPTSNGSGRGAPDTSAATVKVRKSDLADPAYALNPANAARINEAQKAGTLLILD